MGLYMTADTAQTWVNIPLGPQGIQDIAVTDTILYAVQRDPLVDHHFLARSRNWGQYWDTLYNDPLTDHYFDLLMAGPDTVLFAIPNGLYYATVEADTVFHLLSTAFNQPNLVDVNLFIDRGVFWAQCFYTDSLGNTNNTRKLFRSTNRGQDWQDVTSPLFYDWYIHDLANWGGGVRLYATSGMYSSFDDGLNWSLRPLPTSLTHVEVVHDTAFAATDIGFMYLRHLENWSQVFDGLPAEKAFRSKPTALQKVNGELWVNPGLLYKYDPATEPAWTIGGLQYAPNAEDYLVRNDTVIARNPYSASRSTDQGLSWEILPHPDLVSWDKPAFAFSGDSVLYGIDQGRFGYASRDMGTTWDSVFSWGLLTVRGMGVLRDTVFWYGTPGLGEDQIVGWDHQQTFISLGGPITTFLGVIGDELYTTTANRLFRYLGAGVWHETANKPPVDIMAHLTEFTGNKNVLIAHYTGNAPQAAYSTDKGETWSELMPKLPPSLLAAQEIYVDSTSICVCGSNANQVYELWCSPIDSLAPIVSAIHTPVVVPAAWTIVPNPASGPAWLVFDRPLSDPADYRILDATGRCIVSRPIATGTSRVLLEGFGSGPAGVFTVLVIGKEGMSAKRLVGGLR